MLQLKQIKKDYLSSSEAVNALKGIDLSFRKNEFVSILGPSGCGKTTLLNIIGGLDHYTSGDLVIGGRSTKSFNDRDWDVYRNHRIGFIFQSYNLIPHQTVLGNVELALTIAGMSKEERVAKAKRALDRVGLSDKYYKKPNQLSGGQCQRVAIARALVNDPEILLADEPTGALDTVTSVQIMELIKEISSERLVIMVTHNPELADRYSDRIVRLLDGQVIEDSNPFSPEEEEAECAALAAAAKERAEKQKAEAGNDKKKLKKLKKKAKENAKMSFFTAFMLSARNLISKKGRTVLVGFAGSIGIVGIAMVLAFSGGIKGYIASMQDDMLSGNPITITEMTYDLNTLMGMSNTIAKEEIVKHRGRVYVNSLMSQLTKSMKTMESLMIKNEISKDYIDYLDAMPKEYCAAILYDYGINPGWNIYTEFKESASGEEKTVSVNALQQIYTSILEKTDYSDYSAYLSILTQAFKQAPGNREYILSQYDVIEGEIADEAGEIMIVLDGNSRLTDLLLTQLGYFTQEEFLNLIYEADDSDLFNEAIYREYFTHAELLGKTFTWYPNDTVFEKNTSPMAAMSPFDYNAYADGFSADGAITLKVSGILQPKEDISYGCLTSGVYFTPELTELMLESGRGSEIVSYFKENNTTSITSMKYQGFDTGITYRYSFSYLGETYENVVGYVGQTNNMAGLMGMMGSMGGGSMGGSSSGGSGSSSGSGSSVNVTKIYTLSLAEVAGAEIATSISVYPVDFDRKDDVTAYLDRWNGDGDIVLNGRVLTAEDRQNITYTDTLALIIDMINTMIDIVSAALIAFTSISLVVSTVMIGIITYVSVVERVKEIGVIRALGGRKKDVSHLFNAETFIIGLLAGLIGIGATYFISAIANVIIKNLIGISSIAALPFDQAILLVCISVVLTLVSGLIPAKSAARKDPVVALRTE